MYLPERNLYINDKNNVMVDLNSYRIFYLTENIIRTLKNYTTDFISYNEDEKSVIEEIDKIQILSTTEIIEKNYYDTIKIHVSNTCNLRCKYCYAQGGNYGGNASLMHTKTADKVLKMIYEYPQFQKLKDITFFGGEPLLAWKLIEYICKNTQKKQVRYLLQTNGTILNDNIIKILKEYNIYVTVSIDGFEHMHDYNRIDKFGKGTYQQVIKNIKKMKANGIKVVEIQATISSEFANQYTKQEIADVLYKSTDVKRIKVEYELQYENETIKAEEDIIQEIENFFDKIFKEAYIFDNDVFKVISTILCQKYKDYICSAGNRMVTVDVNGRIFPCQLFLDNKLMYMGESDGEIMEEGGRMFKKSAKKDCRNCFARSTCYVCAAKGVSERKCKSNRILTEKVLEYITMLVYEEKYIEFYNKPELFMAQP